MQKKILLECLQTEGRKISMSNKPRNSIVLVHGGFVDGSGWEGVYKALKRDGYNVSVVQNPTASLTEDVAVTKRAIAAADGDVILVGHSYGGVVVTEAGTDSKVAGLVYITAFAPDKASRLLSSSPILRPVRRLRRSFPRRMASYCSTARSSLHRSLRT
jgi:pimeloyl-ACP methyl ester carboxylesterase